MGVPILRIIVYWDLYWGPPILGNYHMALQGNRAALCWALLCYTRALGFPTLLSLCNEQNGATLAIESHPKILLSPSFIP